MNRTIEKNKVKKKLFIFIFNFFLTKKKALDSTQVIKEIFDKK